MEMRSFSIMMKWENSEEDEKRGDEIDGWRESHMKMMGDGASRFCLDGS